MGIGIGITNSDVSNDNKMLLSQAVDIFHKHFTSIVDSITGSDFIPSMAYGQTIGDSDFKVQCAMLIVELKVVTAGMLRVFVENVAEHRHQWWNSMEHLC
ncbi:unnamed protein product [Lactuca virosa]|uniref:Increased DNA methylation 1 C-terminal domain-containing protein n=1 Tax=Lactuca virosa TaxID=75947 RepID=A0AAU9NS08_9ASTR|nr:unnamed protein product [Lactuca virosa]